MELHFSFIVPVYNRPDEVRELLQSLQEQDYKQPFEVVLVEDGSTLSSADEVAAFSSRLDITYLVKENSGPGDSRNYGMARAKGNYFIVLDSDCILPQNYLSTVARELQDDFVYCFGGPDAAHASFSPVQKAIDHVMTSFLTTGGIRGGKRAVGKFQPRSFNMGLSKEVFEATKGFGNIHPGEDPDLTFRIWALGYRTKLLSGAQVYHKRRIDWPKFHLQVKKFGMVRPILNKWHPGTKRITYWFPTIFSIGLLLALFLLLLGWYVPLLCYVLYFLAILASALVQGKGVKVAFLAVYAAFVQLWGYGWGFLKSTILVTFNKREPEELFPKLFFKK